MRAAAIVLGALAINLGLYLVMEGMISRDRVRVLDLFDAQTIEFVRAPVEDETRTKDRRKKPPPKPRDIKKPKAEVDDMTSRSELPADFQAYNVSSLLGEGGGVGLGQRIVQGSGEGMKMVMASDLTALAKFPPQYPFWALREGLINAIIHRDYSIYSGGMGVEIYPDRIEIWNSGRLPKGWKLADLKKSHPSQPANPHMAHVFYLRGIIEQVGRGTLKIVDDCQAAGLRSPEWKEVPNGIKLVFHGRHRKVRLNQRQRQLIARMQPGDSLQPSDYYQETEGVVSERQSRRDLSGLEKGGWLRQEGQGPATVYVRTDQPPP